MAYSKTRFIIWLGMAALAAGVLIGCKKEPQPAPVKSNKAAQQQQPLSSAADQNLTAPRQSIEPKSPAEPNVPVKPTAQPTSDPKRTLREIIAHRWGWGPAYVDWYGKEAPDFTVTDINGRKHTLSEYRGRNVMLIFWATWCRPCIKEIPHLIELRNTIGEDKLAMLAISHIGYQNSTEKVKRFVAANPVINYTVISVDATNMPRPYNLITSIPSNFFIDPEGRIKLATEGLITLPQMKAIIEAER